MILFLLVAAHFLCDYPLQGDFLSRGKGSFKEPHFGIPWWHCMAAHSLIHGGAVALILGDWRFGVCEAAMHFVIDTGKAAKAYGIHVDQAAHLACKVFWFVLAVHA